MKHICKSLKQLDTLVEKYVKGLKGGENATVLALHGDLGSGKTTFTKSLAKQLGVKEVVTSPTFVIEKIYRLSKDSRFRSLIHIDAYRLEREGDLSVLGWGELLEDPSNLIVIEWPEIVKESIPTYAHYIEFEFIDESTRKITW